MSRGSRTEAGGRSNPDRTRSRDGGRRGCAATATEALAFEIEFGVGRSAEAINRGCQLPRNRSHEIRRHDDDQFGLVTLVARRAEQSAKDRNVTEERRLRDVV